MAIDLKIPLTSEMMTTISRLDHFGGQWSAQPPLPGDRLSRIEEAARARSVAASCRMAGIRVTDAEVAGLLRGEALELGDARELLGYSRAMVAELPGPDALLSSRDLRDLHATMMGTDEPSEWRADPLHREAFDAEGRALGIVFPTLPPRLVEDKTDEMLTWLELELRSGDQHPLLVIGVFLLGLFAVSPFDRGNARLVRLLIGRLLTRAGYRFLPYASVEGEIEETRREHHRALLGAQTHFWSGDAKLTPWLSYLLSVLDRHRGRVAAKIELERDVRDYPPLQRQILEAVREHGDVDAALLLRATGANRNTLKDNLRRLVLNGVLEKTGQRRGTRYRMSSGEPAPRVAPSIEP